MNIPVEVIVALVGCLVTVFVGGVLTAILAVQGWMLMAIIGMKVQIGEVRQSLKDCRSNCRYNEAKGTQ
jgi:hypothetical protein